MVLEWHWNGMLLQSWVGHGMVYSKYWNDTGMAVVVVGKGKVLERP